MSEQTSTGASRGKQSVNLVIGILIAILLAAYMFTFQVRYDEVAVVTTFDKATPPQYNADGSIDEENPGSLKLEPGLYFKWFWPIQSEYKYPKRVQVLEDQLEEQQTADGYAVIVNTYLAYRISDPHAFFRTMKDEDNARAQLRPLLREIRGIISQYEWNQLVNTDASKLRLAEIEAEALEQIQSRLTAQKYGIEAERFGIRRVVLPEAVTEKVFERMRQTRQSLAERARAEGDAKAAAIRSEARSAQQRILAFAERRAQAIRAEGDREAATYYRMFQENEQFAVFLRRVEALKAILANNTTFVLTAQDLTPLQLLEPERSSPLRSDATLKPIVPASDSAQETVTNGGA